MKRKPSTVSVVLFIVMFIIFYFLEQRLHIFANTINTSPAIEAEAVHLGNVEVGFITSSYKALISN